MSGHSKWSTIKHKKAAIDAKRGQDDCWEVYISGGRGPTGLDAVEWAVRGVELGAGEILLTSVDREGTGKGFDVELVAAVSGGSAHSAVSRAISASASSATSGEKLTRDFRTTATSIRIRGGVGCV